MGCVWASNTWVGGCVIDEAGFELAREMMALRVALLVDNRFFFCKRLVVGALFLVFVLASALTSALALEIAGRAWTRIGGFIGLGSSYLDGMYLIRLGPQWTDLGRRW